jgi:hypothetical protein
MPLEDERTSFKGFVNKGLRRFYRSLLFIYIVQTESLIH